MGSTTEENPVEKLVSKFTAALAQVEVFPAGNFSNRLFNKIRLSNALHQMRDGITAETNFGEDPDSQKIHGIDNEAVLNKMGAQVLAMAIAALDSSDDPYNFRGCVDNEKAKGWFEDSVIRVAPLLVAEHISSQLRSKDSSLPSVTELCQNTEFVQVYHQRLKTKAFIHGAILKQVVEKTHHYSTNLLFMLAYFESKVKFDKFVATNDVWTRTIGDVGAAWILELIEGLKREAEPVADHISQALGPVFAYDVFERKSVYDKGKLQTQLFVNNSSLSMVTGSHPASAAVKQIQDKLTAIGKGAESNWKAVQDHLWEGVKASTSKLRDAVRAAACHETTSDKSEYGLGWSGVTTSVVRGDIIAVHIGKFSRDYPEIFIKSSPSHQSQSYRQNESFAAGQWCVIAGTAVTTKGGPKNVEDLLDGDEIVTVGSVKEQGRLVEYGKTSNETRKIPVRSPTVFGINGSAPFFTASHVFHTTTGLRAIDAAGASKANPLATIGELRIGHVLLRLGQDNEYEKVNLESLNVETRDDISVVYDVHLTQGRSFHANGYLTSVGYPEVSPKQVAAALSALSPRDRLRLLYEFPELQDLLSQHDSVTLSAVLSKEIKQEVKRRTARLYKKRPAGADRVPLMDIDRTFQLLDFQGSTDEQPPNTVTVHEGVVLVNNIVVAQAQVVQRTSSILWTRPAENGKYEHGQIDLDSTGLIGRGAVAYSESAHTEASEAAEALKPAIFFRVTALPSQAQQVPAGAAIAAEPSYEMLKVEEPLAEATPIHMMAADNSLAAQPLDQVLEDLDFTFTLQMDEGVISATQDISALKTITTPTKFGNVILRVNLPNGPKGIKVLSVSVPHLNRLTEAINNAAPEYRDRLIKTLQAQDPNIKESDFKPAGHISSLYTSSVVQNEKGQLVANVRMINASSLAQLADFSNGLGKSFDDALPNSHVSVPLIFQELELVIRSDLMSAQGSVSEWDSTAVGMNGKRHFIRSTTEQYEDDAQKAKRSETAAKAGDIVSANPNVPISNPQAPPSPVAGGLDLSSQLDCESLVNLENYDEYSIHKTTSSLLQATLRYHLDEKDREIFIPGSKNEQLPLGLKDKLPEELKTWITTKYNKAYISFLISQGVKNPFDEKQSAKLWYWWQGSGPNTLRRSPEYTRMNQIVGIYAMRQLYDEHLRPYLLAGGKHWADELKKAYSSDAARRGLMMGMTTMKNSGINPVNKICNLMNTLDPDGTQAKSFYNEFLDFAVKIKFFTSPYIGDSNELKTFLYNAMYQLLTMVLNGDESLDADLRASIMNDIEPIRKQKQDSVKTQVDLMSDEISYMTSLVVKEIASVAKGFTFKGVDSLFAQIEGKIKPGDPTPYPKTFKALRACAIIGLIGGGIVMAVTTFMKWDDLSDGQKGLAICSILQTVSYSAQTLRYFKKNPIVELRRGQPGGGLPPGQGRRPAMLLELADAEAFAQNIQEHALLPDNMGNSQSTLDSSRSSSSLSSESSNSSFASDGPLPVQADRRPKFNVGLALLKALDIFIGIGFVVFMSMEIRDNWKSMTEVEKWLSVTQVVIQGLIVIVDISTIGVEIAVSVGWIAVEAATTALCCLATVGAVLGVIALAVMIGFIIYEATRPKPPTEAEKFAIANKDLVNGLPDPPKILLDYAASPSSLPHSSTQDITVTLTNKSSSDVVLQQIGFYFNAGGSEALLKGGEATKQDWGNSAAASADFVGVRLQAKAPACGDSISLDKKPPPASIVCLGGSVCGQQVMKGQHPANLLFKAGEWVKVLFRGMVADQTGDAKISFIEYSFPPGSSAADLAKQDVRCQKT